MTEKRRKQIVYAVFALAVIWGAFNFPSKKKTPAPQMPTTTESAPAIAATTPVFRSTATLPEEWGRDPFARGSRAVNTLSEAAPFFHLTAVSVAGGKALAMIDGQTVGKGDSINGWRVASISNKSATLESNGRTITLKIGGE